ncbi:acetyl-CoA carboxylase biotin carboxylase subunit [Amycolatopsis sp. K13G38]|uniref:biotin carboxylase n=1 Tax=Amycolatopsis acididurans TaxID=2724524 RepID=A0ABX1IXS2_9PSEU|nr:acetyl-CoA carboxylase biotin carboxylase subunit [Amycolatopsis acididurans]
MRRLLVANRGEIAVRIIRAARDLGIETVAVYSAADRGARHTTLADRAVCIGPPPAPASYLRHDLLLQVAEATGCDAVHPGYGFLSEDASFAAGVADHGLTFVGPPARAIEQMGDKAIARKVVAGADVPVVPGSDGVVADVGEALRFAADAGYPVLLKARSGGGGRGMRVAKDAAELERSFPLSRQEAGATFGDDGVYVERYLPRVRHVEVQVLADHHGRVGQLGERDCSLQRRHQKLLEEAPSPALDDRQREELCAAAVRAARAVGYASAGTVEFLLDLDSARFFFIEMNTRIQVEHPVTEMLTGVDLVAWQLRIAAGEPLTLDRVPARGHAIEFRINAEDWTQGFRPSPGTLSAFQPPAGPGVRVDTHSFAGATVPPHYDSLLAKLIVHGADRDEALRRSRRALDEFHVAGVASTVGLHRWLLEQSEVADGTYTTSYLTERT